MSGQVRCCSCGKCCGPISDWADEGGIPAHILHDAYECKDCEEDHWANLQAENTSLMESTDYSIPPAILAGLEAHRDKRQPTGDFLTAVLENNLTQAVGLADDFSMSALRDIVMWCYWELPAPAWGSEQKVAAWRAVPSAKRCRASLKHVSGLVGATMATIESYLDAAHDCGEQAGRRDAEQNFHRGTDHEPL